MFCVSFEGPCTKGCMFCNCTKEAHMNRVFWWLNLIRLSSFCIAVAQREAIILRVIRDYKSQNATQIEQGPADGRPKVGLPADFIIP